MILIDNKNNNDPYINAAIEEYVVRRVSLSDEDHVMLYINQPCVVVGRNQSIWKEVNFGYLRDQKPVIRRISGGGTVYHDGGNVCFAFFSRFHDSKVNNYRHFNQPIADALKKAGIDAQFNDRNDILWQGKKISGNAQFTDRKNILSHGTILVNSDLARLRQALGENDFSVESKAVSSVRSPVMNISEGTDRFSEAAELMEYLAKELLLSDTRFFSDTEWQEIMETVRTKFMSHEWIWGRNPRAKVLKPELTIDIEEGRIAGIAGANEKNLTALMGCWYTYADVKVATEKLTDDAVERASLMKMVF